MRLKNCNEDIHSQKYEKSHNFEVKSYYWVIIMRLCDLIVMGKSYNFIMILTLS